jgi:hypothetical protein
MSPKSAGHFKTAGSPARPKLDWRLSHLIDLQSKNASALRQLKAREDGKLRAIEVEVQALRERISNTSDVTELTQLRLRMRGLYRALFAPLTSGLHYPGDTAAAMRWPVPFKEPFLTAFIVTKAEPPELKAMGVIPRRRSRDVYTAWVPFSAIGNLETSSKVSFVELARPLFPMLNDVIPSTGIATLQNVSGHKGKDVIVAVIDNCLDFRHEDFRVLETTFVAGSPSAPIIGDPVAGFRTPPLAVPEPAAAARPPTLVTTSKSRVLFLWDQRVRATAQAPQNPRIAYGVEYDDVAMTRDLNGGTPVPHVVFDEHGTLVTGCAAGNGRALDIYKAANPGDAHAATINALTGAAPEADIIFVAHAPVDGTSLMADSTAIQDAFAYAFDQADALGKACVVNLSDSDNQGAHDGTAAGELFLNGLLVSSEGRAIVLAAGNANGTAEHASGVLSSAATMSLQLDYHGGPSDPIVNPIGGPMNSDVIEIWYPGTHKVLIKLKAPNNIAPTPTLQTIDGPLPDQADVIDTVAFSGQAPQFPATSVSVTIHSHTNDPRNHANLISITIAVPAGGYIPIGTWTIELTSDTDAIREFHAWLDRNNRGYAGWRPAAVPPPPGMIAAGLDEGHCTIGVPATAESPIAVGWHEKTKPPVVDGNTFFESGGRGKTRDGRQKPDLVAPGRNVLCPYPTALAGATQSPPGYATASGSSVSAPIVAGACALIFECLGRQTTVDALKGLLAKFAGKDAVDESKINPALPEAVGNGYLQMVHADGTSICDGAP